jgi:hypothetical protein
LQKEVTDAEEKLARLYRLVEDGVTDLDDVLKARADNAEGYPRPRECRPGSGEGELGPSYSD